ncbi:Fatty acyl-coa reductase [Thalictrum thalictroides]|uniref:Fatty acyl-CoA reductase n=1 Tax=Thalictrum thalictroides TaxID=46969 RepID=A0A7J6WAY4_THATH|nr:Fatty acyl-coa reductase [Thalictrum thalictroides]
MEFSCKIVQSLENKSILVTGSTGFLAKIFVEKVLRVQPNVNKLYLLIRATDTNSAKQRLHDEVIGKDLFRVLRDIHGKDFESFVSSKLTPVPGDVIYGNMGVQNSEMLEEMWSKINIIVNVAGNTKFDERYDVALDVNTFGSINVMNFAKNCIKLEMLLHVSTAYVCGEKSGRILEKPFRMGETPNGSLDLDILQEQSIVHDKLKELESVKVTKKEERSAMKELGMKRASLYGWPNTYAFTKAMAEMIMGHSSGNLPLVIIRPTVVTSTYKEPFPGWIEGTRHIDSLAIAYGTGKVKCFVGNPTFALDVIPGDMVANAMIAAMVIHANQCSGNNIYHVGSSSKNPCTPNKFADYGYHYFFMNPVMSKDGKPIIVRKPTLLTSVASFRRYMGARYIVPLKVFKLTNVLCCCNYFHRTYSHLKKKINYVMYLMNLFAPYVFFEGIFDDQNTERLRIAMKSSTVDAETFYFDPKCIDWEDYSINIHLPGLVKYGLEM